MILSDARSLAFKRLLGWSVVISAALMMSCQTREPSQEKGKNELGSAEDKGDAVDTDQLSKLLSLPYVRGSVLRREHVGVTTYNRKQAWDGHNLYCSSHSPTAYLMSMTGEVIHTWHLPMDAVWPDQEILPENEGHHMFWRRIHMWDNGDLLAVYSGLGLVKIDRDSRLMWAHRGGEHHDFDVAPDGLIYSLARKRSRYPGFKNTILEDFIHVLDPQGKLIENVSLLSCLENSEFKYILERLSESSDTGRKSISGRVWQNILEFVTPGLPANIFHANTIEYLNGAHVERSPVFREGNILMALRNLHTIVIVDLNKEMAVWGMLDRWRFPHQPTFLDSGNILIFDNLHTWDGSAVLEFDPLTGKELWNYRGTPEAPFFSPTQGSNQRLPNGNTLITDSNNGRAFEVTQDGLIVWEFIHPHRVGNEQELTANLCELIRLNPKASLGWLVPGR